MSDFLPSFWRAAEDRLAAVLVPRRHPWIASKRLKPDRVADLSTDDCGEGWNRPGAPGSLWDLLSK